MLLLFKSCTIFTIIRNYFSQHLVEPFLQYLLLKNNFRILLVSFRGVNAVKEKDLNYVWGEIEKIELRKRFLVSKLWIALMNFSKTFHGPNEVLSY